MKSVKFDDVYSIEIDEYNLTLRKSKPLKAKTEVVGYYANWENLFDALIRLYVLKKLPENQMISFRELISIYKESREDIFSVISVLERMRI